jgi:hypothetical protein
MLLSTTVINGDKEVITAPGLINTYSGIGLVKTNECTGCGKKSVHRVTETELNISALSTRCLTVEDFVSCHFECEVVDLRCGNTTT